jgi:hypothetical protein
MIKEYMYYNVFFLKINLNESQLKTTKTHYENYQSRARFVI